MCTPDQNLGKCQLEYADVQCVAASGPMTNPVLSPPFATALVSDPALPTLGVDTTATAYATTGGLGHYWEEVKTGQYGNH